MCVMTTYVLCTGAQRSHPPARPKALGTRPRPGCLSPGRRGPMQARRLQSRQQRLAGWRGEGLGKRLPVSGWGAEGCGGKAGPGAPVAALRLRVPRVPPCATAAAAASSSPLLSRPLRPARATSSAGHRAGKSVATALGAGQRLCCGARPARTARRSSAFCMPGTGDADRSPAPASPSSCRGDGMRHTGDWLRTAGARAVRGVTAGSQAGQGPGSRVDVGDTLAAERRRRH